MNAHIVQTASDKANDYQSSQTDVFSIDKKKQKQRYTRSMSHNTASIASILKIRLGLNR